MQSKWMPTPSPTPCGKVRFFRARDRVACSGLRSVCTHPSADKNPSSCTLQITTTRTHRLPCLSDGIDAAVGLHSAAKFNCWGRRRRSDMGDIPVNLIGTSPVLWATCTWKLFSWLLIAGALSPRKTRLCTDRPVGTIGEWRRRKLLKRLTEFSIR